MTYHVNGKGEPGLCGAQPGNCPFGSSEDHYETADAARLAFERSMQDQGWIKTSKVDRQRETQSVSETPVESKPTRTSHVAVQAERRSKAREEARARAKKSSDEASQIAANSIFFMG